MKFMAQQTRSGWEILLQKDGAKVWTNLFRGEQNLVFRLADCLRGVVSDDITTSQRKTLQVIRPKGWAAPIFLNPCIICDTVDMQHPEPPKDPEDYCVSCKKMLADKQKVRDEIKRLKRDAALSESDPEQSA